MNVIFNGICRASRFSGIAVILTCCVFNYAMAPFFICLMGNGCKDPGELSLVSSLYSRSQSVSCFVSYTIVLLRYRAAMTTFNRCTELLDEYSPTSRAERCRDNAIDAAVTFLCLAAIVPVNVVRLALMYTNGRKTSVMLYFVILYSQNICNCMLETRFVRLCCEVNGKFVKINRDLERIDDGVIANGRPSSPKAAAADRESAGPEVWVLSDGGVYHSQATGRPLFEVVEELKIRHRLVRETLDVLQDLFAAPMGLSLCTLCIATLFEIYYNITNAKTVKTSIYLYTKLIECGFRFFIIVKSAHVMTNQALQSNEIVTNISTHILDISTKDELQVFSNQISSSTMEFTIFGLFTLNSQLITSAVAVITTYLVFWLQISTKPDLIF